MRTVLLASTAVFALAGCSSLPKPLAANPVTAVEVVNAIECEMASIYDLPDKAMTLLSKWTGGSTLTLDMTDTASVTPGISFTHKSGDTTFKNTPGGAFEDKNARKRELKFKTAFASLDPETADGHKVAQRCSANRESGLGLAEWLADIGTSMTKEDSVSKIDDYSYEVTFTVTRGVSGGLSFQTGDLTLAIDKSNLQRIGINKLAIDFVTPDPKAPKGKGSVDAKIERKQLLRELDSRIITVDPDQIVVIPDATE